MSDGGLGNIFDAADEADAGGQRGPDLRVSVEVSRHSLGDADGFVVAVPERIDVDGQLVSRKITPGDPKGGIRLHLPEGFADGATLRLRGQGGVGGGGLAGDLYVTVRLTNAAVQHPQARSNLWIAVLFAIAGIGAVWFLLRP